MVNYMFVLVVISTECLWVIVNGTVVACFGGVFYWRILMAFLDEYFKNKRGSLRLVDSTFR